jgi:CRISPR/Cas system-associated endoribonuclease Cas2
MRRVLKPITCILFLFAMGCSSVAVEYDYDLNADFSDLKKFAWMTEPDDGSVDTRAALVQNSLFSQRLKRSVTRKLESRGYELDTENPDFVIVYHTGVQDRINVTNWGYTYGPYWGPWGESVDVHQYTEGTLVLDFIDYGTKQIVWRGVAKKALASNPKSEQVEKNIDEVVEKLLVNFPPK